MTHTKSLKLLILDQID